MLHAVCGLLCTVGTNFVYDKSFLRVFLAEAVTI
jgi:hypothetical protein